MQPLFGDEAVFSPRKSFGRGERGLISEQRLDTKPNKGDAWIKLYFRI